MKRWRGSSRAGSGRARTPLDERELSARLRDLAAPGEDAAARRAWLSVEAGTPLDSRSASPLHAGDGERRATRARADRGARHRAPPARDDLPARRRVGSARPQPRARRRAVVLAALALASVLAALTPPGEAVADWLRDAVMRPAPRRAATPPARLTLPAGGALLARTPSGLWTVAADGTRRRLGAWDDGAWSPSGRFVVAVRGSRLAALDRRGRVRWSLERPYRLAQPAWAPDGVHVAYRSANGLRLVAGDGTGDRFLAGPLGPAGPAWRPDAGAMLPDGRRGTGTVTSAARHGEPSGPATSGSRRGEGSGPATPGSRRGRRPGTGIVTRPAASAVAWADRRGSVRLADAATGQLLWAGEAGPAVRFLRWSADGSRVAAISRRTIRIHDANGQLRRRWHVPRGQVIERAAPAPGGATLALVLRDPRRAYSQVVTASLRGRGVRQPLFGGRGTIADVAFSPAGGWLLVGWQGADQWLLLRTHGADRAVSIAGVGRRLDPRSGGAYPRVLGWCCSS